MELALDIMEFLFQAVGQDASLPKALANLMEFGPRLDRLGVVGRGERLHQRQHFDDVTHLIFGRDLPSLEAR